jgi:hypothetical protein
MGFHHILESLHAAATLRFLAVCAGSVHIGYTAGPVFFRQVLTHRFVTEGITEANKHV